MNLIEKTLWLLIDGSLAGVSFISDDPEDIIGELEPSIQPML